MSRKGKKTTVVELPYGVRVVENFHGKHLCYRGCMIAIANNVELTPAILNYAINELKDHANKKAKKERNGR